ncbi:MAG: hypothetical protein HZA95_03810 [Candidatus Vogelbacteria bacterium]|nr:hypothetical protein [Candidatus Vogelbacteria bacterium]
MINLLPILIRKELHTVYSNRTLVVALLAASFLLVLMMIMLVPSYFMLMLNGAFGLESQTVPDTSFNTNKKEALTNDINRKVNLLLEGIKMKSVLPTEAISLTINAKSKMALGESSVQIFGFEYSSAKDSKAAVKSVETSIKITGNAKDRGSLKEFVSNIESDPAVKSVDVPVNNFLPDKNLLFSITAYFK